MRDDLIGFGRNVVVTCERRYCTGQDVVVVDIHDFVDERRIVVDHRRIDDDFGTTHDACSNRFGYKCICVVWAVCVVCAVSFYI